MKTKSKVRSSLELLERPQQSILRWLWQWPKQLYSSQNHLETQAFTALSVAVAWFLQSLCNPFFYIADFAFTDWSLVLDSITSSWKALIWLRSKLATGFWANRLDDDALSDSEPSTESEPVPSLVSDDSSRGRLRGGGSEDAPSLEDVKSNRCILVFCDDMSSWNIKLLPTPKDKPNKNWIGFIPRKPLFLNISINRGFLSNWF